MNYIYVYIEADLVILLMCKSKQCSHMGQSHVDTRLAELSKFYRSIIKMSVVYR